MARDDDTIEPRLGRIRSRGSAKRGQRYLQTVLRSIAKAGGPARGDGARSKFHGNRIGRGAGVGRVLSGRDRYASFRARRVIVKARIVKMAGRGLDATRLHLRYIQRDGVTREGAPGELYDAARDRADGRAFLERSDGDRHQFRFIVNAEDRVEYDNLKDLTRRLMQRVEDDLGTKLDWVAVDHHNTGQPHTHVVVRGRDDTGKDLVIAREYMARGFRARASELVTLDLGPRTDRDIEERLLREVGQERFTSIDQALLRAADETDRVEIATLSQRSSEYARFQQTLRVGRLRVLEHLGLATETAPGAWQLSPELEPTLRRLGERGDIIKTLHHEMSATGLVRSAGDYAIYDPSDAAAPRVLVGRVVARGLADEIEDRHYLVIDAVDGRTHWVDIGRGDAVEPTPEGAIVSISPRPVEPRAADRTVAEIAGSNGGRYSVELHHRHDPTASAEFVQAHVRRLEALRRARVGVDRLADGTWAINADHFDQAATYERGQAQAQPVRVEILSALPLGQQLGADGATWLDRTLISDAPTTVRDAGFGREIRGALARRRQWLIAQELARDEQGQTVYRRDLLDILRRREINRVASQLSSELGLAYSEAPASGKIEGVYRRRVDLASGPLALIEKSREFTLVPWRPALERCLGTPVTGMVRGESISWSHGRRRSGPSIS
jgi:type IV secretory pathway VirD2 relaxase